MFHFTYSFTLKAYSFPGVALGTYLPVNEDISIYAESELEADQRAMARVHELSRAIIEDSIGTDTPFTRVELGECSITAKDGIPVIGFFNWCDTYCIECRNKKHINVLDFSALYADDDNEYTCDMCGHTFNEQPESVEA